MDSQAVPDLPPDHVVPRLVEVAMGDEHSSNPSTQYSRRAASHTGRAVNEPSGRQTREDEPGKSANSRDKMGPNPRPLLRRDNSVPAQPMPPSSQEETEIANPTDSLSLFQLKKLVSEMPKLEPAPYAFTYADSSDFEQELEEWFTYGADDKDMLLRAESSYNESIKAHHDTTAHLRKPTNADIDWTQATDKDREDFVRKLLEVVAKGDGAERPRCLEALVYIVLGCWRDTAWLQSSEDTVATDHKGKERQPEISDEKLTSPKPSQQVIWIKKNVDTICGCGGVRTIFEHVRASCTRERIDDNSREDDADDRRDSWCGLTLLYVILEVLRTSASDMDREQIRAQLLRLEPSPLVLFTEVIARYRWDDTVTLPLNKVLQLTWKLILILFGGIEDVERAKASFQDKETKETDKRGQPVITASPLDYHLFRQEISSKYPAFNPPPPLFPLEPENNSILPPLYKTTSKFTGANAFSSGFAALNGTGVSILHQPVHIATPAPSPPPSPAGPGGKGGKKQNYQTNQLFPFLYPPLDESSNDLGGKGTTDLQDALVGRKWEGSDIPASILEAAELFARRMRATRAMKQMWEERVEFMKYERGWEDPIVQDGKRPALISGTGTSIRRDDELSVSIEIESRMTAVEEFYRDALPHMQSLVIVLLKVILSHVTTLIAQSASQTALQSGFHPQDLAAGNNANKPEHSAPEIANPLIVMNLSDEELDNIRMQEILAKSVSGILILLLKWFKLSHVFKFEYFSQLLLDSNYIPLILKLLQTQELEKVVNYRCDREALSFFYFCRKRSRHGPDEQDQSEEDEAAPPPVVKLRREKTNGPSDAPQEPPHTMQNPPEVDELGFPTSELPAEPITNFSWRNFFASINYLRIMQKLCKNKAHRNLLLVQYKSSQFLRKCLKVPQPELRLYTLKLFKNQVPYCGRKWRQSNMRVITAVYLHCRPELRDDWLAGSDVDAEVEEALPLEQALRALTHWHNLKRYADKMGTDQGILEEEQDFFVKELQKMDWGEEVSTGDEAAGDHLWDAPLQVDGW